MKYWIITDQIGNIMTLYKSSDPYFIPPTNSIEIEEPQAEMIKNTRYFKYEKGVVLEKSDIEKKAIDEEINPPKNTFYEDLLKKITDLELKVKALETKVK